MPAIYDHIVLDFGGLATFSSVPDFSNTGKWYNEAAIGSPEYEKAFFDAPGVDSRGVKRFGFRQAKHIFIVTYVDTSIGAVAVQYNADVLTLGNQSFDIGYDTANTGPTFYRCELDSASSHLSRILPTGYGTFYAIANIGCIQIGLQPLS
jgi:hypothetical protein